MRSLETKKNMSVWHMELKVPFKTPLYFKESYYER